MDRRARGIKRAILLPIYIDPEISFLFRIPKRSRGQEQQRSHLQENSIFVRMEPQHTDDVLKHLEKQKELLKEAHQTMLQELQKLEVEHETMMRKLYELMNTHTLNQKIDEVEGKNDSRLQICKTKEEEEEQTTS
ncbi:uncharacterized protein LOC9303012 isoform X2 [Arabidopsis lyrata subsp. lyrata]|uniref:uncharacterized protein LOC9303012 isoform X2 n=1 Tax=Arabidopsis lyrata subsp. lyrata TaxID=81972 RepID=UPI000A29D111|nr:uncharacterized protein LOC9303012 isoform X2 [Arabidopsis lyrata subsp. lyrata]|eukprot:XP_020875168.1 uncharacterized protein LOC9303012 isoform X2 [Arabidopsis lyrata subsp. lyrata]